MKVDISSIAKRPGSTLPYEALMLPTVLTEDAESKNVLSSPMSPTTKRRRERLQREEVSTRRHVDYCELAKRATRSLKFEDQVPEGEPLSLDVTGNDSFATVNEDGQIVLTDKELPSAAEPSKGEQEKGTEQAAESNTKMEADADDGASAKASSPLTIKNKHSVKINVTYVPGSPGKSPLKMQQISSPVSRSPYGFPSLMAAPTPWKRSKELQELIASRRKPQLDRSLLAKRPEEQKEGSERGVESANSSIINNTEEWASVAQSSVCLSKNSLSTTKPSISDASQSSTKKEEVVEKRRCPRRQHTFSWIPTDASQLAYSEKLVMKKLSYFQARIAGLNTISNEDITHLDDSRREAPNANAEHESAWEDVPTTGAAGKDDREILILIHGFGGGLAGWAQNWQFFSERYRVYAFDLPGFARSERKKCKATNLAEAMDVMCGYFDRWFNVLRFEKPVILLAHSFGSFISAHFTMRHGPSLVKMLLFADPWGVHRGSLTKYKSTTIGNKFLLYFFYSHRPLSLLRSSGPIGPYLMRKSRPDLANNWKDFLGNVKIMHDYIYHCNAMEPPMGEELFKVCCHFDVAATQPLQDVLPSHWNKEIPIGFVFGEKSCYDAAEPKAMADQMGKDGFTVAVDTVPNAGHQVFSDNAKEFNERVYNMIQNIELKME